MPIWQSCLHHPCNLLLKAFNGKSAAKHYVAHHHPGQIAEGGFDLFRGFFLRLHVFLKYDAA